MAISLTSPVTGGAQTGLTSPTYTVVVDTPPNAYTKQWAVTALGGTQTGVDIHSAASPFTISFSKPANLRTAPMPNPVTGAMANVPRNVYGMKVRKGAKPGTNQSPQVSVLNCDFSVPAGADVVDPEDIRAATSLLLGAGWQQSANIGDLLISAIL